MALRIACIPILRGEDSSSVVPQNSVFTTTAKTVLDETKSLKRLDSQNFTAPANHRLNFSVRLGHKSNAILSLRLSESDSVAVTYAPENWEGLQPHEIMSETKLAFRKSF